MARFAAERLPKRLLPLFDFLAHPLGSDFARRLPRQNRDPRQVVCSCTNLVALVAFALHKVCVFGNILARAEERGFHVIFLQHIEESGGVLGGRTVVER